MSLNQVLGAKTSASLYSKGVTSDFLLKRIVDLEKGGEGKNTIEYHVSHKANILDKNFIQNLGFQCEKILIYISISGKFY